MSHIQANTQPPVLSSRKARIIAVSSGKGGVGKTSISLNLAITLSLKGSRVCVLDADRNLANISILVGLNPGLSLYHWLKGDADWREVLQPGPMGVSIIAAASGLLELVGFDPRQQLKLITLCQKLEHEFDFILIDNASGINETVLGFQLAASENILVITTEPASWTDAFAQLKVLKSLGFKNSFQLIVNKAESQQEARNALKRFVYASKQFLNLKLSHAGYIDQDQLVSAAAKFQKPFVLAYPESPASRCMRNFAASLLKLSPEITLTGVQERKFTEYFKYLLHAQRRKLLGSLSRKDWQAILMEKIRTEPLNEVEYVLNLAAKEWKKRLELDLQHQQQLQFEQYRSALRFAQLVRR